jgi:hypothetical protein
MDRLIHIYFTDKEEKCSKIFRLKRKIYILKKKNLSIAKKKKKKKKNSQFTKVTDWD